MTFQDWVTEADGKIARSTGHPFVPQTKDRFPNVVGWCGLGCWVRVAYLASELDKPTAKAVFSSLNVYNDEYFHEETYPIESDSAGAFANAAIHFIHSAHFLANPKG
jgi:hypothetical protein